MNPLFYIISGLDVLSFATLSFYGFVLVFFKYETNVYTPVCVLFPLSLAFFAHGLRINGWANEELSFQGMFSAALTLMALPLLGSQLNLYATFSDNDLLAGSAPGFRNVTSNTNRNTSYYAAEKALVVLVLLINLMMSLVVLMYNFYFICYVNAINIQNVGFYRRIALYANLVNEDATKYIRPSTKYIGELCVYYPSFSVESLSTCATWFAVAGFVLIMCGTITAYVGYTATTSAYYPQFMDPIFMLSGALGLHIRSFGLLKRSWNCFGNRFVLHALTWIHFTLALVQAWYGLYRFNQTLSLTTAFSGLGTLCIVNWTCYQSLSTTTTFIDLSARYVMYAPWPDANVFASNSMASAMTMILVCTFGTVCYAFITSKNVMLWLNYAPSTAYLKLNEDGSPVKGLFIDQTQP